MHYRKKYMSFSKTVFFFIKFGSLIVRVWSEVVENLAADKLLRIPFIERYLHGIFPSERKMRPWNSSQISIPTINQLADKAQNGSKEKCKEVTGAAIRVAEQTKVPPNTRMCVPVNSSATSLFRNEPTSFGPKCTVIHVAAGIAKHTKRPCSRTLVYWTILEDYWSKWYWCPAQPHLRSPWAYTLPIPLLTRLWEGLTAQ